MESIRRKIVSMKTMKESSILKNSIKNNQNKKFQF